MPAAPSLMTALLLAGGRATRMGDIDKGMQPFRGATLAAHVLARLGPQAGLLAISANRNLDRYAALGAPVWTDDLPGFQGPLAGLATALRRCATPLLLTAPCDSPFLPSDLAERLLAGLQRQHALVAVATCADRMPGPQDGKTSASPIREHPVFALIRTRAAPHLSAYLARGGRRMGAWHDGLPVARVHFDDAAAFRNFNTLEELQQFQDS